MATLFLDFILHPSSAVIWTTAWHHCWNQHIPQRGRTGGTDFPGMEAERTETLSSHPSLTQVQQRVPSCVQFHRSKRIDLLLQRNYSDLLMVRCIAD